MKGREAGREREQEQKTEDYVSPSIAFNFVQLFFSIYRVRSGNRSRPEIRGPLLYQGAGATLFPVRQPGSNYAPEIGGAPTDNSMII